MYALFVRLELRRAQAVSLSQMERNILGFYFTWEVINLFLGGILSASLTRWEGGGFRGSGKAGSVEGEDKEHELSCMDRGHPLLSLPSQ
jgi:hypothetical protein